MSKAIKMVTNLAGTEIPVGDCHPGQARVLVKQDLAAWQDGKLLLLLRPAFLELLSSNEDAWKGPLDDANVSGAERDRRMAWFKQFIRLGAEALSKGKTGSDFAIIHEAAEKMIADALFTFLQSEPQLQEKPKEPTTDGVVRTISGSEEPEIEKDLPEIDPAIWMERGFPDENVRHYLGLQVKGVPVETTEHLPNWSPTLDQWGDGGVGIEIISRVFCKIPRVSYDDQRYVGPGGVGHLLKK